jgi:GAF domain-containing protein
MPGCTGAWYLPDVAHDRLTVAGAFGPAAGVMHGMSVAVGDRLTGWVAASRQPIINSQATLDLVTRVNAVSPPLTRCISVPLMVGDAVVAVLTLYTAAPDGFTAHHSQLIQIVAPHLAGAINLAVRIEAAAREAAPGQIPAPRDIRLVVSR